jgi:hypothetical protein
MLRHQPRARRLSDRLAPGVTVAPRVSAACDAASARCASACVACAGAPASCPADRLVLITARPIVPAPLCGALLRPLSCRQSAACVVRPARIRARRCRATGCCCRAACSRAHPMIALYAATAIDMPSAKSANIHFFMTHRLLCGDAPLHDRELLPIRTLDAAALRRKCAGFVIMNRRSTHADTPYGRASTTYREYNGFRARILPLTVFPSCAHQGCPWIDGRNA